MHDFIDSVGQVQVQASSVAASINEASQSGYFSFCITIALITLEELVTSGIAILILVTMAKNRLSNIKNPMTMLGFLDQHLKYQLLFKYLYKLF